MCGSVLIFIFYYFVSALQVAASAVSDRMERLAAEDVSRAEALQMMQNQLEKATEELVLQAAASAEGVSNIQKRLSTVGDQIRELSFNKQDSASAVSLDMVAALVAKVRPALDFPKRVFGTKFMNAFCYLFLG